MCTTIEHPVRGFTLIELLVTLAILAVLGTLAVPVATLTHQRSKEAELRSALKEIREAIDAYKRAGDEGQIEVEPTATGYPPSLEVLVNGVPRRDQRIKGKLYFLRRVPPDPMNDTPGLAPADTWGLRSFASEPQDPQPGPDVYDVYSRSVVAGLNGIPYRQW
jgi:general secretion pathway protein G